MYTRMPQVRERADVTMHSFFESAATVGLVRSAVVHVPRAQKQYLFRVAVSNAKGQGKPSSNNGVNHMSMHMSMHVSLYMTMHMSMHMSMHMLLYISMHMSMHMSMSMHI